MRWTFSSFQAIAWTRSFFKKFHFMKEMPTEVAVPLVERQKRFINSQLIGWIIEKNSDLRRGKLLKSDLKFSDQLNGFMSNLYHLDIVIQDEQGTEKSFKMIIKLMKGDDAFRKSVQAHKMCVNEVFVYKHVLPAFTAASKNKAKSFDPEKFCPRVFFAESGHYEAIGDKLDTILVLENISPLGFRMGPRIDLNEDQLMAMTRHIAGFHACSYAMRILGDSRLEELKRKIIPLNYVEPGEGVLECYRALFQFGLNRLFAIINRRPELLQNTVFAKHIHLLKSKFGQNPIELAQYFLSDDKDFSVFLHGDYNRNNVLFRFNEDGTVAELRMFDFQEHRYGSPSIDVAFLFYVNMYYSPREKGFFDVLLRFYHDHLIKCLSEMLESKMDDKRLERYGFEQFQRHFRKNFFHGVLMAIHFIPWVACPEEECAKLAEWWAKDMFSDEMAHLNMVCGGEDVDERVLRVVLHASENGFMDVLEDLPN